MKKQILICPLLKNRQIPLELFGSSEALKIPLPDLSLQETPSPEQADFIFSDVEALVDERNISLIRGCPHKFLVFSDRANDFNIQEILFKYGVNHIIGLNSKQMEKEIRDCLQRELGKRPWSIEEYLDDPSEIQSLLIKGPDEIGMMVDQVINQFNFSSYFESPVDYLRLMANELITNAIFNANIQEDGRNKYTRKGHEANLQLAQGETVLFKMGMNKDYIILSVRDQFGSLTKEKIIQSLERSSRTKRYADGDQGAGLGMYLVYSSSNRLIFNIHRGQQTEVLCIIETNKRFKSFQERITSFHFYQEDRK